MKLIFIPVLIYLTRFSSALECYSCTADLSSGIDETSADCWRPGIDTATLTCATDEACEETLKFVNGIPTDLVRACVATDTKRVTVTTCENSNFDFGGYFSTTNLDASGTAFTSTCKKYCTTDKCNGGITVSLADSVSNFETCDVATTETATKWCDVTDGLWYCLSNLAASVTVDTNAVCTAPASTTATDPTPIKCVQCTSDIDADCWSSSTATDCEETSATTCAATTTVIYDNTKTPGNILRETIIRSCSSETHVSDRCTWTSVDTELGDTFRQQKSAKDSTWGSPAALVCALTCDPGNDGDGCNSINPDGKLDDSNEKRIYCASSSGTSTSPTTTNVIPCNVGVTQCYSKVEYLKRPLNPFQDDWSNENAQIQIISHERGCGASTTNECKSETITASKVTNLSIEKITCEETCDTDNCNNNNWPQRVKCLRDNEVDITNYAVACASPDHNACYIKENNYVPEATKLENLITQAIQSNVNDQSKNGFTTTISRGCYNNLDFPDIGGCTTQGMRTGEKTGLDIYFESCNTTCTSDGCNFGSGYSGSWSVVGSLMVMVISLFFGKL